MRLSRFCLASMFLVGATLPVAAADLSTIDQVIKKEPAYRTGKPKYCLLVFGPEAKTPVWLVQDGDTLYVDRNGNGDLTEAGERVAHAKDDRYANVNRYVFNAGDIRDGSYVHKGLQLRVEKLDSQAAYDEQIKALLASRPDARGYTLVVEAELPGWKGGAPGGRVFVSADSDASGILQFGDQAASAPIIHVAGPWHIVQFGQQRLVRDRQVDVNVGVGTPGLGPGTTAFIAYTGVIPTDVFPTLDITYPPAAPGSEPVREKYELKQRC